MHRATSSIGKQVGMHGMVEGSCRVGFVNGQNNLEGVAQREGCWQLA